MKNGMEVALPLTGIVVLFLFWMVVLVTGPAPQSQLFAYALSPVTRVEEQEQLYADQILSLLEIHEINCHRLREQQGDPSLCWITDYWPLPKSIEWPLNS